jgi:hypothetical protein
LTGLLENERIVRDGMGELIRFDLEGGGSVLVEGPDGDLGIARASRMKDAISSANVSFEGALTGVRNAAVSALQHFRDVPQPPDEVIIEFGVELSGQAGAVIAQAAATSHMQVTLTWHRSRSETPTDSGASPACSVPTASTP